MHDWSGDAFGAAYHGHGIYKVSSDGRTVFYADAPADYVQQMLRAIVGIRIPVTRLVGKWKVSQNRSAADREGVAATLAAEGGEAEAMAQAVRRAGA